MRDGGDEAASDTLRELEPIQPSEADNNEASLIIADTDTDTGENGDSNNSCYSSRINVSNDISIGQEFR